jgi:tetratricopeptide (TPR) repeat protein
MALPRDYHVVIGQLDGKSRGPCYADRVRVRAGATALVALTATLASRASADEAIVVSCGDPATPCNARRASAVESLVARVATTKSRAALSEFLVAAAVRANQARDWSRAIPLYQALVVARGPASPEARQLATLWMLAGQHERAAEVWSDYAAAIDDPAERTIATAEAARLVANLDPFADKLVLADQAGPARHAFALGRAAYAAGRYGDALVEFHIGYALAPELPGFLRELGATYDKLGATEPKREFYRRYLVQRPFGGNAELVRAELAKDKDVLGTLQISSSLPCTELWLNRQKLTGKLPQRGFVVAPGRYKGLCFNPKLEMALFEYATVEPGQPAALAFRWGIVENRLERPLGRIALENPRAPGVMIDLGITSPEVGVAAPADGKPLKMILTDDAGVRTEVRSVQIEPGQRLVVKW